MTNKSLAALFFGCILTASAASAQSLLPKPQSFVAGKGAFSTDAKLKVVNEVGADMSEKLATVPHVKEVRGLDFMHAVDLDESVDAPALVTAALKEGLLLNATGAHTLRFLPPLVCEKSDIDTMVQRLSAML